MSTVEKLSFISPAPQTLSELNSRLSDCFSQHTFEPLRVVFDEAKPISSLTFRQWIELLQDYLPNLSGGENKEDISTLNKRTLQLFPNAQENKPLYQLFVQTLVTSQKSSKKKIEKIKQVLLPLFDMKTPMTVKDSMSPLPPQKFEVEFSDSDKLCLTKSYTQKPAESRYQGAISMAPQGETSYFLQRMLSYLLLERAFVERVYRIVTLNLQMRETQKKLIELGEFAIEDSNGTSIYLFAFPKNASAEEIAFLLQFNKELMPAINRLRNGFIEEHPKELNTLKKAREIYLCKDKSKLINLIFDLISIALAISQDKELGSFFQNPFWESFQNSSLDQEADSYTNPDNYLIAFGSWLITEMEKLSLVATACSRVKGLHKEFPIETSHLEKLQTICSAYRECYKDQKALYDLLYSKLREQRNGIPYKKQKKTFTTEYFKNLCPWNQDPSLPEDFPPPFEFSCVESPEERLEHFYSKDPEVSVYYPKAIKPRKQKLSYSNVSDEKMAISSPLQEEPLNIEKPFSFHYAERVERWFDCPTDNRLSPEIFWEYQEADTSYQNTMKRLHGFSRAVDHFYDYGIVLKGRSETTQEKITQYIIPAEFSTPNETLRGVINYCVDANQVCYHRFFHIKLDPRDWVRKFVEESFTAIDFPELKTSTEDLTHRTLPSTHGEEDRSIVTKDPVFGIVTIQDPKFENLTIRLLPVSMDRHLSDAQERGCYNI